MVRASFDSASLTINEKELGPKIAKMGEAKKAMPFVQGLKKRLNAGENKETVFDRKLAFDEIDVLLQMRAGLRKTTGCVKVDIVAVEEGGKNGRIVGDKGVLGEAQTGLPAMAEGAVPGNPSFHFENIKP